MRKSVQMIANALLPLGLLVSLTACNEDDVPRPGYSKAELHATLTSNSNNSTISVGALTIQDFILGTQDVNMMYLPKSALEVGVTLENGTLKSNLEDPLGRANSDQKTLVLASGGEPHRMLIGEGETPNGLYDEITFKLHKNNSEAANNKSFFMAGELDGKPVQIWLENEDILRATSRSTEGYEVETNSSFLLTFQVDQIFANVNFDSATDFDKNGIIEIGPNNADSNGSIHTVIKSNIPSSISFVKE